MSEHEVWNELGNLYCISGMLGQASYAYSRAINLQKDFGMPYSNLAYVKLQQGNLEEAADLYKLGIELLVDDHHKALSWYRLGDVFRKLKNYRDAIMAYQQADSLDAEAGKHLEESQAFLYGPSNIPFDAIPTVIGTQVKMEEEPDLDRLGFSGDIPQQTAPTQELISPPAPPEETADPSGSVNVPDGQNEEDELSPRSMYEFATVCLPGSNDEVENDSSETYINPDLQGQPDQAIEVDLFCDPAELGESLMFTQQQPEFEHLTPPSALPQIMPDTPPANAALVEYSTYDLERQRTISKHTDLAVLEEDRNKDAMCVFVQEEDPCEPEKPEPVILPRENGGSIEGQNNESTSNKSNQLFEEILQLEAYLNRNPRNARKWNELAVLYNSAGMYEQSISANQCAAKLVPDSPIFLYELGISYGAAGRHEDAIDCMQRVIELNPEHSHAHATLSGYYRKKGLDELADQHIGDAMKNYIDDENQYNRACLEALCGNVEAAVEFLRKALEGKQIYIEWVLRDPDLDSIRFAPQFKDLIAEYAR